MSEVIKTVLTADSSALAAEFAKASSIAQKYAADREAQGSRALATARAEVEALRMEASGHGSAAAALREKMQLTEQARQLAAKAGITEENATRILGRQLELKKQILATAAAQVAAEQRAARLAAPGRNGIALPELALNAANLQAMDKAAAKANELRRQLDRAGRGGYNAGLGMLALSQGIEDAQYGMSAILNNIPMVLMNFGATAGLAAGISMAAVAVNILYPRLKALYGAADNEILEKAREEWGKVFSEGMKAADAAEQAAARTREMAEWSGRVSQELTMELGIRDQILQSMEREIRNREKTRSLATEIRTAEEALAAARGQTNTNPTAGRKEELERIAEDIRVQRELSERAQAESQRLNNVRENTRGTFTQDETAKTAQIEALRRDLAGAEANVASFQKRYEEAKKAGTATFNDEQNIKVSTAARDELKQRIADLEAIVDASRAVAATADTTAATAIEAMDQKANAAYQEAAALEELLAQRKKLLEIEDATAKATAARLAAEKKKKADKKEAVFAGARSTAAEELEILRARAAGENNRAGQLRRAATLEREILTIMREQNITRAQATAQAKERQQLEQNMARGEVMGELKALQMEAGGNKAGAERLREETRIRQEAVALAERLGISETQAQNILREKARLQKEIADREKNAPRDDGEYQRARSRIYKKTADEPRLTRDNLMNDGFTGLRRYELQRRGSERAARPAKPSDDPAKNLLKSVNIQEEMLKIWQKLNVV